MKRHLLLLTLALGAAACSSGDSRQRYCGKWLVNVRECPGTADCAVMAHYEINTPVELTGRSEDLEDGHTWYELEVQTEDGVVGWVRGDLLVETEVTPAQLRRQLEARAEELADDPLDRETRNQYAYGLADWAELHELAPVPSAMVFHSMADRLVDDVRAKAAGRRPRSARCGVGVGEGPEGALASYRRLHETSEDLPEGDLVAWRSWSDGEDRIGFVALHRRTSAVRDLTWGVFEPTGATPLCVYGSSGEKLNGTERRVLARAPAALRIRP